MSGDIFGCPDLWGRWGVTAPKGWRPGTPLNIPQDRPHDRELAQNANTANVKKPWLRGIHPL